MTEPTSLTLTAIRESYDTVAAAYAEQVPKPAELDPLSRGMLAAFAEQVRHAGLGPVADLGCGPGHVTAHLRESGVRAIGVDLSAGMVRQARHAHPDLAFAQSSMTALGLADDVLGGILAWYSTHHTPPALLPDVFAEFHRTLVPGGLLLWGCHVGDEHRRPARGYGHPVSYEWYLLPVERVAELLERAGLVVTARLVQEPAGRLTRQHACLLARKA
ncbi:class I SAM-dependent DNA methyltransferase [Streptomyces sp. NPDC001698]|uniref:class I SAM-dependent DNA methyltransferase n=1 Tax=unclassified Streptomyces TaxID=2593676 RepID=UPI00368E75E0